MTPRLLILRPEPGAGATAARARALGLETVVVPLFEIGSVAWQPPAPDRYDAVMITSANAVRMGGPALDAFRGHRLYVVGQATAAAARDAGFDDLRIGPRDAAALAGLAASDGVRRLLHLAGADHVAPDAAVPPGTPAIDRVIVYASRIRSVPPAALPVADVVALLHSARAAAHFATLMPDRGRIAIAAISDAAASAAGPGWRACAVADRPDDPALLAVAARLCDEWHRQD